VPAGSDCRSGNGAPAGGALRHAAPEEGSRWRINHLGLSFVRNPGVGLLTLTLLTGALLLVGGVLRLVSAFQPGAPRGLSILSGVVTLVLGLMLFSTWPVSALWFLGTLVGVELIVDGITMAISGRLRPVIDEPIRPTAAEPTPPVLA